MTLDDIKEQKLYTEIFAKVKITKGEKKKFADLFKNAQTYIVSIIKRNYFYEEETEAITFCSVHWDRKWPELNGTTIYLNGHVR